MAACWSLLETKYNEHYSGETLQCAGFFSTTIAGIIRHSCLFAPATTLIFHRMFEQAPRTQYDEIQI